MPRGNQKKKNRYFTGRRTATKITNREETRDGAVYFERKDRSKYPKLTSIPCTEFVRRMLAVFKQAGGYQNYDELLFDLVTSREESHSLPKNILDGAKNDIKLRTEARNQAIMKKRYYPRVDVVHKNQRKIDSETKEFIRNMAENEQVKRKKRLRKQKGGTE